MIWLAVVVGLLVLLLVSSFLHLNHKFHIIKTLILVFLLILLVGSIFTWFGSNKEVLNSPKNTFNAIYLYLGWLGDIGSEMISVGKNSVTVIGNVIKNNQTKITDGRK